jgi:hypothetical protein
MARVKKPAAAPLGWRTLPEAGPDLKFVVRDLQRTFLRVAIESTEKFAKIRASA